MEEQPAKRRRVYSLEPNKIVRSVFTRNYINYLVPALMKIREKNSVQDNAHSDFKNMVMYEVGMAMVLSAQGFAWSNGLKVKLERDRVSVATSTSFLEKEAGEGSSRVYDQNEKAPLDISSNHSSKTQAELLMKKDLGGEDNENEDINKRLRSLRRLMPGGEGMCDEQMVAELGSYISCLQMQVKVLQCLLAETSPVK